MSDVARYSHAPSPNLIDSVDGWVRVIADIQQLANAVAATEFVPAGLRGKPAAVTAAILSGRELGLAPMTALQHVHMIDGRPALAAHMQRALVQAHGHRLTVVESTGYTCTLRGYRLGEDEPYVATWTMDDAKRAGLDRKTNWQRYPRAMLLARATGELCRVAFADVIAGMAYTSEELADLSGQPDPGGLPEPAAAPTPARRVARKSPPALPSVASDPPLDAEPESEPEPPSVSEPPLDPVDGGDAEAERGHVDPPSGEPPSVGADRFPHGSADTPPGPDDATGSGFEPQTAGQRAQTMALLRALGVDGRDERMTITSALVGRRVESFAELDRAEVSTLIDTLNRVSRMADKRGYLDVLVSNAGLPVDPDAQPAQVMHGPWSPDNPQPANDPDASEHRSEVERAKPERAKPEARRGLVQAIDEQTDVITDAEGVPDGQTMWHVDEPEHEADR